MPPADQTRHGPSSQHQSSFLGSCRLILFVNRGTAMLSRSDSILLNWQYSASMVVLWWWKISGKYFEAKSNSNKPKINLGMGDEGKHGELTNWILPLNLDSIFMIRWELHWNSRISLSLTCCVIDGLGICHVFLSRQQTVCKIHKVCFEQWNHPWYGGSPRKNIPAQWGRGRGRRDVNASRHNPPHSSPGFAGRYHRRRMLTVSILISPALN